jgi:hypothetical protein
LTPSVEKSQSTQALVHFPPGSGASKIETPLRFKRESEAASALESGSNSNSLCDGTIADSFSNPLTIENRSVSCSNVPEKALTSGTQQDVHATESSPVSTSHLVAVLSLRSPDAASSSLKDQSKTSASSASLGLKTKAISSNANSKIDSSAPLLTEQASATTSPNPSHSKDNFAFPFKPSSVMKKIPAVFNKNNNSPSRKKSAMKPTPSQHKALAELASNGELQLLPCNTLNGTQSKVIPKLMRGFLAQIYQYARQRIPTLNEFCK